MKMIEMEVLMDKVSEFFVDPEVYVELETIEGKVLFNVKDITVRKTSETNYIVLTCEQQKIIKLTR